MGRGIAHVCALAGGAVILADVSAETLFKAKPEIEANLWRQVARSRIREKDKAAALGRIGTAVDYGAFADCDIVIEAGWLGRKSARGFYDYSGDKPVPTADAQSILRTSSSSSWIGMP